MTAKTYEISDDCRYARTDEWIRVDGAVARVGISDYAQAQLSDIVFVELPEVGTQVEAGEPFGVVESVKAVNDLFAPVSGEIIEVHTRLEEHPEWLNEDPYGRGWIISIAPEDLDAVETLMSPEEYREFIEERSHS
ncbi:MAG: glycine cleavage system protein GcvH [Myxococcota bacterium]